MNYIRYCWFLIIQRDKLLQVECLAVLPTLPYHVNMNSQRSMSEANNMNSQHSLTEAMQRAEGKFSNI
jgi:hypothetical protein